MNKFPVSIYLLIIFAFLLPTAAGRFLLDLAGGIMVLVLLIPLFLTGLGWIGWKILRSRMTTCPKCGVTTLSTSGQCSFCGTTIISPENQFNAKDTNENSAPASSVTIDIDAEDVDLQP